MGKPNLVGTLIRVKKCTFGEYQSYARFLGIGVLRGCSEISYVKHHQKTHHCKGLEKVEDWRKIELFISIKKKKGTRFKLTSNLKKSLFSFSLR